MKLYHIDRSSHINTGDTIELIKNFTNDKMKDKYYYKKGLSSHGIHYYTADDNSHSYYLDAIFEYERLLNYPNKLSRYQAFYCFDEEGVIAFIENKCLEENFFKIYEVEVDEKKIEKHNMEFIRGWSHQSAITYARAYWECKDADPFGKDIKPIYEYLVKLPITIGKEVKLSEIRKKVKNTEKENAS